MGSEVVLPAPAVGQTLGLCHRGEELGVDEFIPESAVQGFSKSVLPRRSGLYARHCSAVALAPAVEGVGYNLRPLVGADIGRCRTDAGELLQHYHHALGLTAPSDADR